MEHTKTDSSLGKEGAIPITPGREQAYAEVYQVILHMEKGLQIMIPRKFVQFLRKNMDTQWGRNLDFTKNLNDMDLLQETRVLLSLVYRDFICSPEESMELIKKRQTRSNIRRLGVRTLLTDGIVLGIRFAICMFGDK